MATKISPATRIFSLRRGREETPDGAGRELPWAEFRGDDGEERDREAEQRQRQPDDEPRTHPRDHAPYRLTRSVS